MIRYTRKQSVILGLIGLLAMGLVAKINLRQNSSVLITQFKKSEIVLKEKPALHEPIANKQLFDRPGEASATEELERMWNYVYHRQYYCEESKYVGGHGGRGDGAYDLCIEPQFWPARYNKDYKCLMYSFGVAGDFSFDDAMAEQGCEVHSFDPSVDYVDGHVRESGVTFHKIGVSDEDNDHGFNGWKMRTLKTLIKELGHTNRYLDYLKVDTDKVPGSGFEDTVMQELLETGIYKCIRQYSMEIHMPGPLSKPEWLERCRTLYKQMVQLNEGGWRLYNTTDNVRHDLSLNPRFTQRDRKANALQGNPATILWETSFVNFDVEGPCNM